MRVQVQLPEFPTRVRRNVLPYIYSSRAGRTSNEHFRNGSKGRNTIGYSNDTVSVLSLGSSVTCSQHSESENATASDLPGPGRSVGKLFNRLGQSLEALVIKHKASRLANDNNPEVEYAPAGGGRFYDNESMGTLSDSSCSTSDEESVTIIPRSVCDTSDASAASIPRGRTSSSGLESRIPEPQLPPESSRSSFPSITRPDWSILTTCSLSRSLSTNATLSDLSGPGRTLGRGYAALGKIIENGINRLLSDRAPDAVSGRLKPVLRKLMHINFSLRYEDLENADLKGMEDVLGVTRRPYRDMTSTKERWKGQIRLKKERDRLLSTVRMQVEQSCAALLEHASNSALHDMQIRALLNILDLAATYPVARGCFISLHARERIASLPLKIVVPINVTVVNGLGRWPVGHCQMLNDALRALHLLRTRCTVVLEENEVFNLWRDFFLAGDEYEQEKIVLRLLSYLRDKDLAFLAARVVSSVLRRPVVHGGHDFSETTWSEIFLTLSQLVEHERKCQVLSDHADPYRTRIEPDTLDALIRAALERSSFHFGKLPVGFTDDTSPLMTLVHTMQSHENSSFHYPTATEFALMLAPARNRQRMTRATA